MVDAAAFEGHLQFCQFCRRAACVSLFKPTWELLPHDHTLELLALTPASPAGAFADHVCQLTGLARRRTSDSNSSKLSDPSCRLFNADCGAKPCAIYCGRHPEIGRGDPD